MPQAEIGKLNVRVTASANELEATLSKSEARLKGFSKNAQSALSLGGLANFGLMKQGFDEIVNAARELFHFFTDTGKAADDLNDAAEGLGATASGLYAIRAAAIGVGEATEKGMEHLSRMIGQAINGSEEAQAAFRRLGLTAEQLAVLPLDQAALRVNDAIRAMGNAAQQNTAAFEVYSRTGQKLMEWV